MINQIVLDFVQAYILKKDEQLDISEIEGKETIDVPIVKRTERTFRVQGMLTLSIESYSLADSPDEELKTYHFTPRKKLALDDQRIQVKRWMEQGWIMKEVRFRKDGKTVESICYRMGYRLFLYEENKRLKKLKAQEQVWKELEEKIEHISFDLEMLNTSRREAILTLKEMALQMAKNQGRIIEQWTMDKRLRFLHFTVALLQISVQNRDFDWKEIGALYYKRIGGSKEFDRNKEEFIEQIEDYIGFPLNVIGLTSLGRITPLFFAGQLKGRFAAFQYGPVHALTDLAIAEEQYETNAKTLWLVENRAILTRIAAETGFLEENQTLIICNDGHLRSSHKEAISQIISNSSLLQVIIWTDYDWDGLQIARELYQTIGELSCKWISPDGNVITDWEVYETEMHLYLENKQKEQEQILGGAEQWKRWVHH